MTTQEPQLTFVVGKHYRSRDGEKWRVLATDRRHKYSVVIMSEVDESVRIVLPSGRILSADAPHDFDLVAEWTDPLPAWPDWAPPWVMAIAKEPYGLQVMWSRRLPYVPPSSSWCASCYDADRAPIPEAYHLKFPADLNWRECIIRRPEGCALRDSASADSSAEGA